MQIDRSKFRKKIIGPFTGQEFEIRRITLRDYLREIGILPGMIDDKVAERLRQLSDDLKDRDKVDPEVEQKSIRFFLIKGVVSPKIWFGPDDECPEDQVPYDDLAGDTTFLASEISAFSFEMPGIKMGEFFRGAGGDDPGSDGEAVREAPLVDASAGDTVKSD